MKIRFVFILSILLLFCISTFSQVKSKLYLKGASITAIKAEGDFVWFSTYGKGIYRYSKKDGSWFNLSTSNNNSQTDFFYSMAVSKNYVWGGAVDGLYTYDIKRKFWFKRKFALGGQMGNWIRSLCYDPSQNVLWIGRFENLTQLDVKKRRYTDHVLTRGNDLKTNNFKSIALDGDSLVWFGTESGVFKYNKKYDPDDKAAWQFITNKDGGFLNQGKSVSVSDILFEGKNIWFGTDQFITPKNPIFNIGGIYEFNRKFNWKRISKRNGLPANGISCMTRTGNIIWVSVYAFNGIEKKEYGKGLVMINLSTGKISPIDLNKIEIDSSNITALFFDGSNLWIGTDNGVTKVSLENPLARWQGNRKN